jgi:hypothetical protein
MKIGLKLGAQGADVERLHRVLSFAGLRIDPGEIGRGEFGPSTLEALHSFERQVGLPVLDEIDEPTHAMLFEIEQDIKINMNEGNPPAKPSAQNEHPGIVQGNLVDEDGAPVTGARVALFAMHIRSEIHLGDATTGKQGQYSIDYYRPSAFNLVVRAYDASGKVIATSPTVFAAAAQIQIDFTTAASGVVRSPSILTNLEASVAAQLLDTPLSDLKENSTTHELTFLASAIGVPFDQVAYLYIAKSLGAANNISAATFLGIFYQGVPASLDAALASLPDAGIDSAFTAQALSGVLANSRSALSQSLTAAVTANILPASYGATQDAQLTLLDGLRTQSVGSAPYISGKTSLNDLLAAGGVSSAVATAFTQAYAANNGQLGAAWSVLNANPSLPAADLATLSTTLSLGELLTGNIPLLQDSLSRLSQKTLASVQNLALLDQSDWVARITAVDPTAASIPPLLPTDTPQQRIARLAKTLAARFAGAYPTTAFAGGLSKAQNSAFARSKDELVAFLTANPAFSLRNTSIDHFLLTSQSATVEGAAPAATPPAATGAANPPPGPVAPPAPATPRVTNQAASPATSPANAPVNIPVNTPVTTPVTSPAASPALSATALADLKTVQRLNRIGPDYATVEALASAGHNSAQSVYLAGRAPFVAQMTTALGSASIAQMVYARAQMSYSTAVMALTRYNLNFNSVSFASLGLSMPSPGALTGLPDLQALFGSLDSFQCADCQSVYSPAAYLVDLLQYLYKFKATGGGISNARDALFLRRPEIQYIALDCKNTEITIPYIDLVNELFEAAIAPPSPPVTFIDTTGTSAERRALPQNISQAAYALTQSVVFPLTLPFDLAFAQTSAYLNALGPGRAAILTLFAEPTSGPSAPAIACASLGINPEMQKVINGSDTHQDWDRWGLPQSSVKVIDPNTRAAYPTFTDWIAALSKVPVLLNRAGISLQQLYQLLEVVWVTQSGVTLSVGTTISGGLPILSPDLDLMVFTGLTADINDNCAVLDRANRFLRLWTASGLQMWELDWALEWPATGLLDDTFLVFLSGAITVQNRLKLPFQEVLSFWMPLETRDVTNHLGDEDTVAPSTYSEVFRNPAVLKSWSSVFLPLNQSTITGATIGPPVVVTTAQPHGYQTGISVVVSGVTADLAANATFTITVASPTTFQLNGFAGNAAWTSGGVATGILPNATITPVNQNALTAALGLSADDTSAILAFTGAAPAVSLATLNVLLQYQRLSSALSLSIPDLIEWIQLTGKTPFGVGTAPADTLEFLRRLAVLQGTGIAVHDLDYLLRDQSASQSSIAFTTTKAAAALQTVRDAVAKLPGMVILPVTAAPYPGLIEITTISPHGLATGVQVSISGVSGNTNANGTFTITVTSATTFVLNGSSANAAWTGGGTVVATATVTGASYPGLIEITTASPHGLATGALVSISGALGNTAANGTFTITVTGSTSFTLNGSIGNGTWTGGGSVVSVASWAVTEASYPGLIEITTALPHGLPTGAQVSIGGVSGNTDANGTFTITVISATSFTLNGASANGTWTGGGTVASVAPATITAASNASPIAITTTSPHNLRTGAQVSISGAVGNTAANGAFPITVTGPTSFTLNGTTGNGAWTSGGTITLSVYDPTTIQTIVVNALATATGTTANVVTPLLLKTGFPPFDASTMILLVAQGSSVDPTQVPALTSAFTSVAKAEALFTALKPTETEFAFVLQNAALFNWLDPSALPLEPTTLSPYLPFEALLRALQLDRRQTARTPKLFDILSQWLPPNALPPDLSTAIGAITIVSVSGSGVSPIAVTTIVPHGLQTGASVAISNVGGNTNANGTFTITVTGPVTFTLDGGSIGNAAWTGGGAVVPAGLPCLALALNASVSDMLNIATALAATPPSLTAGTQPGSLADMAMLASIAGALDVVKRYSTSGASLVQLAAAPATADTASAAMGALQAQYPQSAWFAAIEPPEDALRQNRRDALVAYMLGSGPAAPTPPLLTTDDIFNYYLIDPEMCSCALTTRLLQASLAIQQFVQQCFLNLFFSSVSVDMSNSLWSEWSWRQQYRLWQANREVFLYPENYVLPETRTNASSFFTDLENDLRQSNCDADAAEAAIQNYLRKLVGVANLQVAAHYNQTLPDGSTVLHVFAHTRGTPPQWYYRTRTTMPPASGATTMPSAAGAWSAWESLNLDIASQQLVPVIWDQRLHLVWPVFKQIAEKASDQNVPAAGGGTASAPQKFWAVEFAMSELSTGQWQAKQTIAEKMFMNTEDSPLAFTFRAWQDPCFNLQLAVYYMKLETDDGETGQLVSRPPSAGPSNLVATATLPMPESPLAVFESVGLRPDPTLVDLSQEPTFALVVWGNEPFEQLTTPHPYSFAGQDLVSGNYALSNPGSVPLYVLCGGTSTGLASIEILGKITSPHIVVPQQELPIFDSADPFFVADPARTYLVQPQYYTMVSSMPQELTTLAGLSQWSTSYAFQTFYHPYARTFLRELEIGGVPQLMARNLQVNPQTVRGWTTCAASYPFNFESLYSPEPPGQNSYVEQPYPGDAGAPDPGESALDFAAGSSGAYSLYNWELFYHVPMFVASLLMQNQQFQDTMTWLEYIFNPTDTSGGPSPQRFWQMAPFNAMNASDWAAQEINNILNTLAADTQQGINDPATAAAILNWQLDPFDPHAVASLRPEAYAIATVMRFLDNLIAWGDWYYNQYTAEMVSQAEQLYILADMILGPRPEMLRPPSQTGTGTATYATLTALDAFSNVLVSVENVVVAPEPPQSIVQGTASTPGLPTFPGSPSTLLFCIPPNNQLLAYWDVIAQRLYNIRHCLNLQGVAQSLPLYAPAINPLLLAEAQAGGAGSSISGTVAPIYRFAIYLQKAVELTNDVRAYGGLILSALEKQDAETLSVLRANQELDIQTRTLDVKTMQVTEAQDQITALQNQKAVVQIRYNFYSTIAFMNAWETAAMALQGAALIANGTAVILDMTSGATHLVPNGQFGASGFGGTPVATMSFGGDNIGPSASSWASVARGLAGILGEAGGMAATLGGYQRRSDEWGLQANLANAELTQMDSQIAAATDRLNIAQKELDIQNTQISNAQAVSDFLTNKYTNAQLYNWMITQLTTVYTQAYQLAFSLALQAQNAYQYELGSADTFIQFGYWDSQHKGLTAGESLLFDLRRMDAQYLAENSRELELTKHVSLALTSPGALVLLRETGTCQIALDEALFDYDQPGQYFRRLRSVALTCPCVTGPYTGVNATLSLTNAMVRIQPPASPYTPQGATAAPNNPSVISSPMAAAGTTTIATSHGLNDPGLFDVNLRDERWLPFEGQGAISTWNLVLDPRDNNFDISTLTDVVIHVRYTARGGGDQVAAGNVRTALKTLLSTTGRSILVSVRNTFGNAYYTFFNPASTATQQTLTLPLLSNVFPFSNLGSVTIKNITFYVFLSVPASGNTINGTFGPTGTPASLSLAPGPNANAALTASVAFLPGTAPQSFTLTVVDDTTLPPGLTTTVNTQTRLNPALIEDILLVIDYSIG